MGYIRVDSGSIAADGSEVVAVNSSHKDEIATEICFWPHLAEGTSESTLYSALIFRGVTPLNGVPLYFIVTPNSMIQNLWLPCNDLKVQFWNGSGAAILCSVIFHTSDKANKGRYVRSFN